MVNRSRIMKAVFTAAALGVLVLGSAAPSRADLFFFEDPAGYQAFLNANGLDVENVIYNDPTDVVGPAPTVVGHVTSHDTEKVLFQEKPGGGVNLVAPSPGQARIQWDQALLQTLYVTPGVGTDYFTAFQADPVLAQGTTSGYGVVTVQDEFGTWTYDLKSGQNFFGIAAINGQRFKSVYMEFFTDSTKTQRLGIEEVKQIRVDITSVPEPAFYQMGALLSLGGIGMLRLRKRRKA
jgi:hypothetical protein